METKNIMIVGVGGQGTLLTSRILGGITTAAGYDVKLSEVHGMSQRGGSVVTYENSDANCLGMTKRRVRVFTTITNMLYPLY